jgi:hypothetical protein
MSELPFFKLAHMSEKDNTILFSICVNSVSIKDYINYKVLTVPNLHCAKI